LRAFGGGEADLDGDGHVSMDELYRYVHDRVLDEGFQEPMKWDLNVRGELIIANSGKVPREDRRKRLREMLLDLAAKGTLPDPILSKAMEVIALNPAQLSGKLKACDALLDQLHRQDIRVGDFIGEWYKVAAEPSGPEVRDAQETGVIREKEASPGKVDARVIPIRPLLSVLGAVLVAIVVISVFVQQLSQRSAVEQEDIAPAGATGEETKPDKQVEGRFTEVEKKSLSVSRVGAERTQAKAVGEKFSKVKPLPSTPQPGIQRAAIPRGIYRWTDVVGKYPTVVQVFQPG